MNDLHNTIANYQDKFELIELIELQDCETPVILLRHKKAPHIAFVVRPETEAHTSCCSIMLDFQRFALFCMDSTWSGYSCDPKPTFPTYGLKGPQDERCVVKDWSFKPEYLMEVQQKFAHSITTACKQSRIKTLFFCRAGIKLELEEHDIRQEWGQSFGIFEGSGSLEEKLAQERMANHFESSVNELQDLYNALNFSNEQ